MTWAADTLPAFKAWLGTAGAGATDDQLTKALTLALATVEGWLDRPLEKLERVEDTTATNGVVRLRAWPVDTVASVVPFNRQPLELEHLYIDKRTGRLGLSGWGDHWIITTTYTAGFDPMPPELELVLWAVAAALLPASQSAAGVNMAPAVRRVTTPDVGTVEYAVATAGEGQADQFLGGAIPAQFESVLSRYRAESIVGGA